MNCKIPVPFEHQTVTSDFWAKNALTFDTSDPGTGKTRSVLDGFDKSRGGAGRMLVIAPLSILEVSWQADIQKFTPHLTSAVAHGNKDKKEKMFAQDIDIVIINHDGIKWLANKMKEDKFFLMGFTHIAIDESTAFKNPTSQRSKAAAQVIKHFEYRTLLTGTPDPNGVCDLWHQAFLLDSGQRLGTKYFQFRTQMCYAKQTGPQPNMRVFVDHDDSSDKCAEALSDITIRHELENCIDMPQHIISDRILPPPPKIMAQYKYLMEHGFLEVAKGEVINPINAGAKVKKLLQLLSGAVYDEYGDTIFVHDKRYELIMDLVAERQQCLVAFNWKHEKEQLCKWAEKYKMTYGVIDGSASPKQRKEIVEAFQRGEIKVIFAHPQSAGHGLTLTAGTTTIWASPTYNAEHYTQFNKRIYRAGQRQKTETIRIAYDGTLEIDVYEKLDSKTLKMADLLDLFRDITQLGE